MDEISLLSSYTSFIKKNLIAIIFAVNLSTSKAVGLFLKWQEVSVVVFTTGVVCELLIVELSSALSIFLQVVLDLVFVTGVS